MTHHLDVAVQLSPTDPLIKFRVDFEDGFENQVHAITERASALPDAWAGTSFSTDSERLAWQERGSRARLAALLSGCLQHGWPYVAYVAARRVQDDASDWLPDYERCYLGWWASRRSFAEEIAASDSHVMDDGERLDDQTIDEVCRGFLCLDIDGQVLALDLMLGP